MQPYFYSFAEFVAMGGHGVFVWSCWGVTVGMMLAFICYSRHQRKTLLNQLRIQQARQAARPRASHTKTRSQAQIKPTT